MRVPDAIRAACLDRAGFNCERCGNPIGWAGYSLHHRRPRAMGGTRRADASCAANLLVLCGSGTTGCHGWVENNRDSARAQGYLLRQSQGPELVPVWLWRPGAFVFLTGSDWAVTDARP